MWSKRKLKVIVQTLSHLPKGLNFLFHLYVLKYIFRPPIILFLYNIWWRDVTHKSINHKNTCTFLTSSLDYHLTHTAIIHRHPFKYNTVNLLCPRIWENEDMFHCILWEWAADQLSRAGKAAVCGVVSAWTTSANPVFLFLFVNFRLAEVYKDNAFLTDRLWIHIRPNAWMSKFLNKLFVGKGQWSLKMKHRFNFQVILLLKLCKKRLVCENHFSSVTQNYFICCIIMNNTGNCWVYVGFGGERNH